MVLKAHFLAELIVCCLTYYQVIEVIGAPGSSHRIQKRNIVQLCNVVNRYTGRGCFDYFDYGCFCGSGGLGQTPVDDADRCCLEHDRCFGEVFCGYYWYSYFSSYSYSCEGDTCTCIDSPTTWPCAYSVCQCDLTFADCLRNTTYENNHYNYNLALCV